MFDGVVADGYRSVFCPTGNYRLSEQIQLDAGITLIGEHKSHTVFKMYHSNSGFYITGLDENGGGMESISVVNDSGTTVTSYLFLQAAVGGTSPDFFKIKDCNLTSFNGNTSSYGIILDGNSRDGTAPNGLIGIRDIFIEDTDIFSCDLVNLDCRNTRGLKVRGVSCYQGSGALVKTSIGGATAAKASSNLLFSTSSLGDLAVDRASNIRIGASDVDGVTITANASDARVEVATGGVTNSGTNTKVLKSDGTVV